MKLVIATLLLNFCAISGFNLDRIHTQEYSQDELDLLNQLGVEEVKNDWVDGALWADGDLPLKTFFDIRGWSSIETKADLPQCKDFIEEKMKTYYSIDPSRAMKELSEVGGLLRLAYSGAKGYPSSTPILAVTSGYQDLIKDSLVVSSTFVEVVLKALKYHKYSILFAEKKLMDLSLKYMKKCSIMAGRMAVESQKLVDEADKLIKLAVNALLSANSDYNGSKNESRRIENMIKHIQLDQAKQKEIKKNLEKMIEDQNDKEKESTALAKEKSGGFMGFIRVLTLGLINPNKGAVEAAERQAEEARKARIEFQEKQKANNLELQMSVEKLMGATNEKNRIQKAVLGLDVTIQTMGKVKTIFLNAKVFWIGVQKHVESLSTTHEQLEELAEDEDFHEEYVNEVANSGYSWLAVGKTCRMAALAIREVDKGVDDIMRKIPTEKEAEELIKSLGGKILEGIKDDNKEIEENIKEDKEARKKNESSDLPIKISLW